MIKIASKKLNNVFLWATLIVVLGFLGVALSAHADWSEDSGYYYDGGGYDSSYYGSNYDSGYFDSGYGYDGSNDNYYYNSGYNYSYDTCYDCGYSAPVYYDTCSSCNSHYTPPAPVVPDLIVSCIPNTYSSDANQSVTWHASVSGGKGSYSYSWSGTDGLSGSGSSVTKSYTSSGSKNAHVNVTSGGKSASADCGSVYINQIEQSLSGSCSVDRSNVNKGDSVHWTANASGGTGSYSYEWSGDYSLSGQTGNNVTTSYDSSGSKNGNVTIRSGNQTITRSCGYVSVEQNDNFEISCSVDDRYVDVGEEVHMDASASGGNGSYSYTWYGSSPLDGRTGGSQYVTYNSTGDKDVRVTVRSNGQEKSRSCGTVHVGNNNYSSGDLNISCTVNTPNPAIGQLVTYNTSVSGGNGSYNYSWFGADGLYGNSSSLSKSYSTLGSKNATVTVTSDGRTKSLNCPVVNVGSPIGLANNGNLASLSSVYLNQVPYTGVGDNPKLVAFIVGLILFSGVMAYAIIFKKSKIERKNKILAFKKENMLKQGIIE